MMYGDAKIVLHWLNTGKFGYILQNDEGGCHCGDNWGNSVRESWERGSYEQHIFSVDAAAEPPGYVTYDGTSQSVGN